MCNSVLFIVNVDRMLNEKYCFNTVEKLSFLRHCFIKEARKIYQVVKFMYRTEKKFRSGRQIFIENIELWCTEALKGHRQRNNYLQCWLKILDKMRNIRSSRDKYMKIA